MGVLRDFVASLAPSQSPIESFLEGQDRALRHDTGVADLTYRRSMNERAKLDNQAAKAEFEDYQRTRELEMNTKVADLINKSVKVRMEIGDMDGAMQTAREGGADIPVDAKAELIDRDGLQVWGWTSEETGESGELGEASQESVRQWRMGQAKAKAAHQRDLEMERLRQSGREREAGIKAQGKEKKGTTRKLMSLQAKKELTKDVTTTLDSIEVEDQFDKGDTINLMKNLNVDKETKGSIYKFISDAVATVEGIYEDQRLPYVPEIVKQELIKFLQDPANNVFSQEEPVDPIFGSSLSKLGVDANINVNEDNLAKAVNDFLTIKNRQGDIENLRSKYPQLKGKSDREVLRAMEIIEAGNK